MRNKQFLIVHRGQRSAVRKLHVMLNIVDQYDVITVQRDDVISLIGCAHA